MDGWMVQWCSESSRLTLTLTDNQHPLKLNELMALVSVKDTFRKMTCNKGDVILCEMLLYVIFILQLPDNLLPADSHLN